MVQSTLAGIRPHGPRRLTSLLTYSNTTLILIPICHVRPHGSWRLTGLLTYSNTTRILIPLCHVRPHIGKWMSVETHHL